MSGLTVHAVVRNRRTDRALETLARRGAPCDWFSVDEDDLAAIVTRSADRSREDALRLHERVVSGLLQRSSVVPLPERLDAEDEEAVRAFLRLESIALVEALEFLEDCYELRVHVRAGARVGGGADRAEIGRTIFAEGRQAAKAALHLHREGDSLLDAAFLVRRGEWIGFVELVTEWEERISGIRVDVTGPWPAWDFVRLAPFGGQRGTGE